MVYDVFSRLGSFSDSERITEQICSRVPKYSQIWSANPARGTRGLNRPAALNDADQDDDDRQHEQDVDEPAQRIRRHQTEEPQDDENYGDSPKQIHFRAPFKSEFVFEP